MLRILLTGVFLFLPLSGWSAMCATVDANNVLIVNTTPVGECVGLVVLSVTDWPGASVWAMPTTDEMMGFWLAGFSVPMSLYLISWAIGKIVSLFDR